MRALSNLINLNQPDLVLFVGEALVGNDAGELWVRTVGHCLLKTQLPHGLSGAMDPARASPTCCLDCHHLSPSSGPADQVQPAAGGPLCPLQCCPRCPSVFTLVPPAVDQLTKFNQRLADLCPDPSQRHLIDGIVLTKFDTIDDKVGFSGIRYDCSYSGGKSGRVCVHHWHRAHQVRHHRRQGGLTRLLQQHFNASAGF